MSQEICDRISLFFYKKKRQVAACFKIILCFCLGFHHYYCLITIKQLVAKLIQFLSKNQKTRYCFWYLVFFKKKLFPISSVPLSILWQLRGLVDELLPISFEFLHPHFSKSLPHTFAHLFLVLCVLNK